MLRAATCEDERPIAGFSNGHVSWASTYILNGTAIYLKLFTNNRLNSMALGGTCQFTVVSRTQGGTDVALFRAAIEGNPWLPPLPAVS